MFQDHALFPNRTVAGNVEFGLQMQHMAPAERQQRVTELLILVGLEGFGERTIDTLSGGEAQRVALARALAPSPQLLMLDEPLGSLDRALRERLTGDLRALLKRLGITVVHVTHDQAEAFAVADRVAVMFDGAIVRVDTPEALWRGPGTEAVARLLGHPNIVVREGGRHVVLRTDALRVGDGGGIDATVVEQRFREGRYATVVSTQLGLLRFEHGTPLAVGAAVSLVVDESRVAPLDG
jgi:ABC-type Fe3+/spermidine/putrescine transport system ATPase subunit